MDYLDDIITIKSYSWTVATTFSLPINIAYAIYKKYTDIILLRVKGIT